MLSTVVNSENTLYTDIFDRKITEKFGVVT